MVALFVCQRFARLPSPPRNAIKTAFNVKLRENVRAQSRYVIRFHSFIHPSIFSFSLSLSLSCRVDIGTLVDGYSGDAIARGQTGRQAVLARRRQQPEAVVDESPRTRSVGSYVIVVALHPPLMFTTYMHITIMS
jgi:hypothetical protein